MLLHDRLQSRRTARVRTLNEAQHTIQTLYSASVSIRDLWKLSEGKRIGNMEQAVGRAQSLMPSWRGVQLLDPTTKPNTEMLVGGLLVAQENYFLIRTGCLHTGPKKCCRCAEQPTAVPLVPVCTALARMRRQK